VAVLVELIRSPSGKGLRPTAVTVRETADALFVGGRSASGTRCGALAHSVAPVAVVCALFEPERECQLNVQIHNIFYFKIFEFI